MEAATEGDTGDLMRSESGIEDEPTARMDRGWVKGSEEECTRESGF